MHSANLGVLSMFVVRQLLQFYPDFFKYRALIVSVVRPDNQHEDFPGDLPQGLSMGVFIVPRKVLHNLLKINQQVKGRLVDGKVLILRQKQALKKMSRTEGYNPSVLPRLK